MTKAAERWWGVKINGEIEDVYFGTAKEVRSNCDWEGRIAFGGYKLPITVDIVPVTVSEDKP